jgi:hypothetical protein
MAIENDQVSVLTVPAAREVNSNYLTDIEKNGKRLKEIEGIEFWWVTASHPHVPTAESNGHSSEELGKHQILWAVKRDENGKLQEVNWDELAKNEKTLSSFLELWEKKFKEIKNNAQGKVFAGLHMGYTSKRSDDYLQRSGLQSKEAVHAYVIETAQEESLEVRDDQSILAKESDVAGEITTQLFMDDLKEVVQKYGGTIERISNGKYERTCLRFENVLDMVKAAKKIQEMVENRWSEVAASKLQELWEDEENDLNKGLLATLAPKFILQLPVASMLMMIESNEDKHEYILMPFSAGISASEWMMGRTIVRPDYGRE